MVLVGQVHLRLRTGRIHDVIGQSGVALGRSRLNQAGLPRRGANMESFRLGGLVVRAMRHKFLAFLIVRLLYTEQGPAKGGSLDPGGTIIFASLSNACRLRSMDSFP
jgi:hypothetical protein